MTGMDNTIEQVAEAIRRTREFQAGAAFGVPEDAHEDYALGVARALAATGLLAPAPLVEETETDQIVEWGGRPAVVERRRRWVTDCEPADRAEGDGSAGQ